MPKQVQIRVLLIALTLMALNGCQNGASVERSESGRSESGGVQSGADLAKPIAKPSRSIAFTKGGARTGKPNATATPKQFSMPTRRRTANVSPASENSSSEGAKANTFDTHTREVSVEAFGSQGAFGESTSKPSSDSIEVGSSNAFGGTKESNESASGKTLRSSWQDSFGASEEGQSSNQKETTANANDQRVQDFYDEQSSELKTIERESGVAREEFAQENTSFPTSGESISDEGEQLSSQEQDLNLNDVAKRFGVDIEEFAQEKSKSVRTSNEPNDQGEDIRELLRLEPLPDDSEAFVESAANNEDLLQNLEASPFEAAKALNEATHATDSGVVPEVAQAANVTSKHSLDRAQDSDSTSQGFADSVVQNSVSKFLQQRKPTTTSARIESPKERLSSTGVSNIDAGIVPNSSVASVPAPRRVATKATDRVESKVDTDTKAVGETERVVSESNSNSLLTRDAQPTEAKNSTRSLPVVVERPAQTKQSAMEGSASSVPVTTVFVDRVRFRNVSSLGLPVSFAVGAEIKKLYPGDVIDVQLSQGESKNVQFHGGGNFGVVAYRVRAGVYDFNVTHQGWQLQRGK